MAFTISLTDTRTTETLQVPFVPQKLAETLPEAVYKDLEIQGHSSELQQYSHTKNHRFSLELVFDALVHPEWDATKIEDARRFIMSLGFAGDGDQVGYIEPSPVLFLWPGLVTLECNVRGATTFEHTRFAGSGPRAGMPTRSVAKLELHVIRSTLLRAPNLRRDGTVR